MVDEILVMIAAVVIAVGVMLVASGPLSRFVHEHPSVKMLALSFLLLIGVTLIADGFGFHIDKAYIYVGDGVQRLRRGPQPARRRRGKRRSSSARRSCKEPAERRPRRPASARATRPSPTSGGTHSCACVASAYGPRSPW